MKPTEIKNGIFNVGVRDWNIRDFHGYTTKQGTTYNAYLILDEKITLIDTVKKSFADLLLKNISAIIDPKKIDFVISNHTEMDHSGALPTVMHKIGQEKPVYCSKMGLKNLSKHFRQKLNYIAVKSGGKLNLGKKNLTFLETKMLHWPDSMFTYLDEEKILFSSDAFGQHYAGPAQFDDEIDDSIMLHAKKYFANILLLYASRILKLVESVSKIGLEIDMICPDHGIVWQKDPSKIINAYVKWSNQPAKKKAVIIYDTMWHSTEMMANGIIKGLEAEGVTALPMCLGTSHRSDVITEIFDTKAVIVGSPTLNNGLFPTISDMLTYMKGLKPKDKIGAAFGSYGWSGESVKLINQELEAMKVELVDPGLKIQYVPDGEGEKACVEFGRKIGKEIVLRIE